MQNKGSVKGEPGASGYSPGDQMHDKGSVKGHPGASVARGGDRGVEPDRLRERGITVVGEPARDTALGLLGHEPSTTGST